MYHTFIICPSVDRRGLISLSCFCEESSNEHWFVSVSVSISRLLCLLLLLLFFMVIIAVFYSTNSSKWYADNIPWDNSFS